MWRDIHSLTVDPDQPTFLRLKLLEEAGFGKAAGVRFDFRGQKGIVLYLAAALAKCTFEDVVKESMLFLAALILVLGICMYWPDLVLWMPRYFSG